MRSRYSFVLIAGLLAVTTNAQTPPTVDYTQNVDAFRQIDDLLASPNVYRNAAGAPGPEYWQQAADYVISVRLDEASKRLEAKAEITYHNNSPDTLEYLWVQLDQNRFKPDSLSRRTLITTKETLTFGRMRSLQAVAEGGHGLQLGPVTDAYGNVLDARVQDTMLRIGLPTPLAPAGSFTFNIPWQSNIVERDAVRSRGGYEYFPDSETLSFFLAQWFPRMAAYTDYGGWRHRAYLGRGEFTLEFGDYDVSITVPSDHVVAATGVLVNPSDALTVQQRERLEEARTSDAPRFIVTPEEALAKESNPESGERTWRFRAENVRDFAWASSRKFIWDGMRHRQGGEVMPEILVMSFYPNEAEPLWSQYSSHSVAHALEVYSRFSFDYPYPTAQSVNTWTSGGMEYPMITFNGFRPTQRNDDDIDSDESQEPSYARSTKRALISVIIHEIGHIYFPMIVNSDERDWAWMDEGINSFVQRLANLEWEPGFYRDQESRGILDGIGGYMTSDAQVPIMTNSDSILLIGPNAYAKVTAALTVLRETVLGREIFDEAFRTYAKRWMFKRPTPGDFFRTMEDAAGRDLDWFWRGWFFSTDHVDIGIADVRETQISSFDPDIEYPILEALQSANWPDAIGEVRNREAGVQTRLERIAALEDFYNEHGPFTVSNKDRNDYAKFIESLKLWEREVLEKAVSDGQWLYFVDFVNLGGLVSPLPLKLVYKDGGVEERMIPPEIWRYNSEKATKLLILDKPLASIELDPNHQTADAHRANNRYSGASISTRHKLLRPDQPVRDLMSDMRVELTEDDENEEE